MDNSNQDNTHMNKDSELTLRPIIAEEAQAMSSKQADREDLQQISRMQTMVAASDIAKVMSDTASKVPSGVTTRTKAKLQTEIESGDDVSHKSSYSNNSSLRSYRSQSSKRTSKRFNPMETVAQLTARIQSHKNISKLEREQLIKRHQQEGKQRELNEQTFLLQKQSEIDELDYKKKREELEIEAELKENHALQEISNIQNILTPPDSQPQSETNRQLPALVSQTNLQNQQENCLNLSLSSIYDSDSNVQQMHVLTSTPNQEPTYQHQTASDKPKEKSKGGGDFLKQEQANELIIRGEFERAIFVLENLASAQRQQLMLAECYLQLSKTRNACESVNKLENIMTSPPLKPPEEVFKLIDAYVCGLSYIRALILLYCTSKLCLKYEGKALEGTALCAEKGKDVILAMCKLRGRSETVASEFGVEMMSEMLTRLRSLDRPSKKERKSVLVAKCSNHVALCYKAVGQEKKSLELFKDAKNFANSPSGSTAFKDFEYGILLSNIGACLKSAKDRQSYFDGALSVFHQAKDWKSDDEKMRHIKELELDLKKQKNATAKSFLFGLWR